MIKFLKLPNGIYINPDSIIRIFPEYIKGTTMGYETSYISVSITIYESYNSKIPLTGWEQVNMETQATSITNTHYKTYKFEDKNTHQHIAKDLIIKLNELGIIDFDFEKDCDDRR